MSALLNKLMSSYPSVNFKNSKLFMWSPTENTVYYSKTALSAPKGAWSLFHELGHATLNHLDFKTDIDLLRLEVGAWTQAKLIARQFKIDIDENHIQNCLDSYRDWLTVRSTCPTCDTINPRKNGFSYQCFNCNCHWEVSSSQLCKKKVKQTSIH